MLDIVHYEFSKCLNSKQEIIDKLNKRIAELEAERDAAIIERDMLLDEKQRLIDDNERLKAELADIRQSQSDSYHWVP